MDDTDYWAIAERDLEIQNPVTDRKMRLLDDYCGLRDGLTVLDIGSGKAWLMRQWAERWAIRGTGLELNPHFVRHAREKTDAKGLGGRLSFVEGPAADYKPAQSAYDIAVCLGASFALGGFVTALEWMAAAVRPGGSIVIGEMTLKHRPAVHTQEQLPLDALDTIAVIERHGSEVSATISASDADFERYVSHHRQATLAWGREHPDHADHAAVLARSRANWTRYLRVIRPHLGWTIYVGRRAGG
jgi:cyclopropane fatty-acyl-phospholipid synthase-like methyltransferase